MSAAAPNNKTGNEEGGKEGGREGTYRIGDLHVLSTLRSVP